jgi:hypothetical protein
MYNYGVVSHTVSPESSKVLSDMIIYANELNQIPTKEYCDDAVMDLFLAGKVMPINEEILMVSPQVVFPYTDNPNRTQNDLMGIWMKLVNNYGG